MRYRLMVIADAPSLVDVDVFDTLRRVFAAVDPRRVVVVDRDRAAAAGGPSDRARLERLRALRALTHDHDAGLCVTGRLDLALAVHADGVQLPERGLRVEHVRALGPALKVGRSCHDRRGLVRAAAAGADWATLSPIAEPFTKAPSQAPLGVDGFAAIVASAPLPVLALGGVDHRIAPALYDAGAMGIASIGYVFRAADPGAAARRLLRGAPAADAHSGSGPTTKAG